MQNPWEVIHIHLGPSGSNASKITLGIEQLLFLLNSLLESSQLLTSSRGKKMDLFFKRVHAFTFNQFDATELQNNKFSEWNTWMKRFLSTFKIMKCQKSEILKSDSVSRLHSVDFFMENDKYYWMKRNLYYYSLLLIEKNPLKNKQDTARNFPLFIY